MVLDEEGGCRARERLLRRAESRVGSRSARAMVPRRACSGAILGGASLVHLRKVDYGAQREALEVAEALWRWEAAAVNLPFDEAELVGRRDRGHVRPPPGAANPGRK